MHNKILDKLTILDRYILLQVLEIFIMGIVIFTSIIFASDTFITLIKQITLYGIPFNIAMMIVLLNLPQVFVMAIPMSVLFSTVMTLNRLSLSSEITVMRACGIGLNRIAKPIFIFAAAMTLLTFVINETIVPITNSQSKTLAVWALGQKNIPNGKQNFTFKEIKTDENGYKSMKRLFFVQRCEDNTLKNVSVVDFSNPKTTNMKKEFTIKQLVTIRDQFVDQCDKQIERGRRDLAEEYLDIVNVIQAKIGCDEYESLEDFYLNDSGTYIYVEKRELDDLEEVAVDEMIAFAKSFDEEPWEILKARVNNYLEDVSANTGMTREDTIARRTICINHLIILCIHACTSEELKRLDGIVKELAENI